MQSVARFRPRNRSPNKDVPLEPFSHQTRRLVARIGRAPLLFLVVFEQLLEPTLTSGSEKDTFAELRRYLSKDIVHVRIAYRVLAPSIPYQAFRQAGAVPNPPDNPNTWVRYLELEPPRFFLSIAPGPYEPANFKKVFTNALEFCAGRSSTALWERAVYPQTVDVIKSPDAPSLEEDSLLTVAHLGFPHFDRSSLKLDDVTFSGERESLEVEGESRSWRRAAFAGRFLGGPRPALEYSLHGSSTRYRVTYETNGAGTLWPPAGFRVDLFQVGQTNHLYSVAILDFQELPARSGEEAFDLPRRIDTSKIALSFRERDRVRRVTASGTQTFHIREPRSSPLPKLLTVVGVACLLVLPFILARRWKRSSAVQRINTNTTTGDP